MVPLDPTEVVAAAATTGVLSLLMVIVIADLEELMGLKGFGMVGSTPVGLKVPVPYQDRIGENRREVGLLR